MRTIGENIDKTAFTSSACKNRRIQYFSNFFFENEFLKSYGNLPKENKLKG